MQQQCNRSSRGPDIYQGRSSEMPGDIYQGRVPKQKLAWKIILNAENEFPAVKNLEDKIAINKKRNE